MITTLFNQCLKDGLYDLRTPVLNCLESWGLDYQLICQVLKRLNPILYCSAKSNFAQRWSVFIENHLNVVDA
jgi:hypothetical protein